MMILKTVLSLVISFALSAAEPDIKQTSPPRSLSAKVAPDSGESWVAVNDLKLEFTFAGYGYYDPKDYGTLTELPLETGERVEFENIAEMTVTGIRTHWRKYVQPAERDQYDNVDEEVDENGYRTWSDVEADLVIVDWNGKVIRSRIERPELADIYLIGRTARGTFKLQLDQENGKKVHVKFLPVFVMQCSKNSSHTFHNTTWKFCPHCGAELAPR
jgi:hypothetical protein